MPDMQKVSGVDIDQDMAFETKEWKVQRIGWVIMALLLLAALLGLFGSGPLSVGHAGEEGGPLYVEYQRIDRYQAPGELKVTAGPNTAQGQDLRISLNQAYVDRLEINDIEPEPDRVEVAGSRLVYVFRVADTAQPAQIRFSYQFWKMGSSQAEVGIDQGAEVRFGQFVLP